MCWQLVKGRCSHRRILRCIRISSTAEVLAAGVYLRVRWFPSEWTCADDGLRVWDGLHVADARGLADADPEQIRNAATVHAVARTKRQSAVTARPEPESVAA